MSVAEDTTQVPTTIAKIDVDNTAVIVDAVVNDLQSTISNTLEAPLSSVSETPKLVETTTKTIIEESQAVIDETTMLVESAVKTAEETISRVSIEMEQHTKKATGLFAKIHKIVKLIMSCIHRADKSVSEPVVVKTDHVNVV